jgi:flagellin
MGFGFDTSFNSGLAATNNLNTANQKISSAFAKLSSGLKINQAKDGPAALIISELLRSQTGGIEQSIRNTQEASNVLGIAEGALNEVSSMLSKMRELALHAANSGVTSSSQVSADQAELNGMLSSIANVASTTKFSDQMLLNGAQSINFTASDPANLLDLGGSQISGVADIAGQQFDVSYSGNTADQAEKAYVESNFGGGTTLASAQEFTLTGTNGSFDFNIAAGTDITDMADIINGRSDRTGVTAYAINGGTELRLVSNDYGSEQSVKIEQATGGGFAADGTSAVDYGQDATLNVNGQAVKSDGLKLEVEDNSFSATLKLEETAAAQTGYDQDVLANASTATTATIGDVKGGMRFQLGAGAGTQNRDIFGIQSFSPDNLGKVTVDGKSYSLSDLMSGGEASLAVNPDVALQIIDQAVQDVAGGRARIGAYQANTLQSNINSLNVAMENTVATESAIRDADVAKEITSLVNAQILEKAALMGVQSSNMSAKNVLGLLGE